jgi:hypothetical protein
VARDVRTAGRVVLFERELAVEGVLANGRSLLVGRELVVVSQEGRIMCPRRGAQCAPGGAH